MDLTEIKGIGINTRKYLNDLGIYTSNDLLEYYPFRYDVFKKTDMSNVNDKDNVVVCGVCENMASVYHFSRKLNKMSFRLNTGDKIYNITIFNRAYLKDKIKPGTTLTVIGKYDLKRRCITASNIEFGFLDKPKIVPIYHSNFKINSKKIHQIILSIINEYTIDDSIPKTFTSKYNFIPKKDAIKIVHNPGDMNDLKKALYRLKYEELFQFMLKINYLKSNDKMVVGLCRDVPFDKVSSFINSLPFSLTADQKKAVNDIYKDLISPKRMNRLLQGDVGCGKTIVAFISLYINYLSSYQGALMAPTEILAIQHYNNITKLFPNVKVCLLKGKMKAKEKKEVLNAIKEGNVDIIIGTHALISENVVYNNLGLVITDEQHRFGVNQRGNLKNKGTMPDILYMSATPIPRTYALTLYGDMDISSIKTMPNGRKGVSTYLKSNKEIKDVLYMMLSEIKKGHQIYVVAPLISDSEKIDLESVYELEEKMKKAFGKICDVGIMHGKMSNSEKEDVMNEFKNGKIKILISTTVIEVGVDVENATMIVIFDAFRFGLSALHQLRGRVGRNALDGYCVLISDKESDRLKVLVNTTDGFKVSEEDFKMRGSGDLFGVRQSGDMHFRLANIKQDFDLLLKAKTDSELYLNTVSDSEYLESLLNVSSNLD